jgi:hypothetical protein
VPEEEVFAVARGKSLDAPSTREQKLLTYFLELPNERQEDLMRIAQTLHREHSITPSHLRKQIKSNKPV